MNLKETVAFLEGVDRSRSPKDFGRTVRLMEKLGNPQNNLKYVHIAGTNGKGSVSRMLSDILTASGIRTGLFTSPHMIRFNERIKVNGIDIPDDDLCRLADKVSAAIDTMEDSPTMFERMTAIGLLYFVEMKVDLVVLEVGLGGLVDATNVIPSPEVAVIAHLALEHTEKLGDTISQIATHKAGIIKPGCEVVLYAQEEEDAMTVVREKCRECGTNLTVTDFSDLTIVSRDLKGQVISYRNRKDLLLHLLGTYQPKNAAVVLDTVDTLVRLGWPITEDAVRSALENASWPGRFQVLQEDPPVLLDGAHNPDGMTELVECIKTFLPGKRIIIMMGVMADKDYDAMLDLIAPVAYRFIAVTPRSHRSLESARLKEDIETRLHIPADCADSVPEGLKIALSLQEPGDAVCLCGSLYQVGDALCFFGLDHENSYSAEE